MEKRQDNVYLGHVVHHSQRVTSCTRSTAAVKTNPLLVIYLLSGQEANVRFKASTCSVDRSNTNGPNIPFIKHVRAACL